MASKLRSWTSLFTKFATVGAFATLTYLILANAMMKFTDLADEWASVIAYLGGMIVSYFGQSKLTFGVRSAQLAQIGKFIVMSVIGLSISFGVVQFASQAHPGSSHYATLAVAIAVPAMSFIVMKIWVFAQTSPKSRS